MNQQMTVTFLTGDPGKCLETLEPAVRLELTTC